MKRFYLLVLMLLLLFGFTSCEHNVYLDDCKHTDTIIHVSSKAVTCLEDGNIEYWQCTTCKKYFEDEACTTETTLKKVTKKAPGAHLYGQWETDKAATCAEEGKRHHTCTRVNDGVPCNYVEYEVIPKTGEHNHTGDWITTDSDKHWKVCPTCTEKIDEEGHTFSDWNYNETDSKWHRECTVCNRHEEDAHASHLLQHHEANPATCTEAGTIEYWVCTICGEYYSDENGNTKIQSTDIIDPQHTLSEWKYDDNKHWKICEKDSIKVLEAEHEWGEYQEQVSGTVTHLVAECTICGAKKVAPKPEYLLYDIGIGEAKLKNIEATPCGAFYINDSVVTDNQSIEIDGSTVVVEFRPYLNSNVDFTPHCYDIDGSMTEITNGVKDEKGNYKVSFTLSNTINHSVNIQVATEGGSLSMTCHVKKKTI